MRIRDLALTSVLMASAAGVSGAQEPHDFDELDTDGDGALTLEELAAGFDDGVGDGPGDAAAEVLALQDMNEDGVISREETGADGVIHEPEWEEDER